MTHMTDIESPAEAIAHEIALHFPEADWQQALAAGESAIRRIESLSYEYAVREDWAFVDGREVIMPVGPDLTVARLVADALTATKGADHAVVRRRRGQDAWGEWTEENDRSRRATRHPVSLDSGGEAT